MSDQENATPTPVNPLELEQTITEIWRPLFDKTVHAQEMAYLIRQCKDETNAAINAHLYKEVKELVGEFEDTSKHGKGPAKTWGPVMFRRYYQNQLRTEILAAAQRKYGGKPDE